MESKNNIFLLSSILNPNYRAVKAVLFPESCIVTEVENGEFSADITISKEKKYIADASAIIYATADRNIYKTADGLSFGFEKEFKSEENVINDVKIKGFDCLDIPLRRRGKTNYQYFRIISLTKDDSSKQTILLYARHIFYDLEFKALPVGVPPGSPAMPKLAGTGKQVLDELLNKTLHTAPYETRFSWSSDMSNPGTAGYFYQQNCIPLTAALLSGTDSFVSRCGGYLHRDNFRFSINYEKEGSIHLGSIIYGINLRGINCVEDWSDAYTDVIAFDNYGHYKSIGFPSLMDTNFPVRKYKQITIQYDENQDEADILKQFDKDVSTWWQAHNKPLIAIDVDVIDYYAISEYDDIAQLDDAEVGDTVDVYHLDLDINYKNLRIIQKDFDVLQQKTIKIKIGEFRRSLVRQNVYYGTITEI